MAGISQGSSAASDRSFSRTSRKSRRERLPITKKQSVQLFRRRLGLRGRAIYCAIDRARVWLRTRLVELPFNSGYRAFNKPAPRVGALYSFADARTGQRRTQQLALYHECNEVQRRTQGYLLFERTRLERERDKRLCRFIAVPYEFCRKAR